MPDGRGSHPNSKRGYHRGPSWVKAGLFESGPKQPEHHFDKRGQTSSQRCSHAIVSNGGRWCVACDERLAEDWRQAWLDTGIHSPRRPQAQAAAEAVRGVA